MQTQKLGINCWSVLSLVCSGPEPVQATCECFQCGISGADLFPGSRYPAWGKENTPEGVKEVSFLLQKFLIHGPSVHMSMGVVGTG